MLPYCGIKSKYYFDFVIKCSMFCHKTTCIVFGIVFMAEVRYSVDSFQIQTDTWRVLTSLIVLNFYSEALGMQAEALVLMPQKGNYGEIGANNKTQADPFDPPLKRGTKIRQPLRRAVMLSEVDKHIP